MKLAHPFIGLIVASVYENKVLKQRNDYSENKRLYFWVSAVLGSVFPDIDAFYMIFVNQLKLHHELLTHSLIPYLVSYPIILLFIKVRKLNTYFYHLVNLFFIGVVLHLLVDSFNFPLHIFSPISEYVLLIKLFPLNIEANHLEYLKSRYFVIELLLIVLGLYLLIKTEWENIKYKKIISLTLLCVLIASVLGLIKTYFIYEMYF